MTIKLLGALLILAGACGVGLALAAYERRQALAMDELHRCLQWMSWQLRYKMPPLAELCRDAAKYSSGAVGQALLLFAEELQQQVLPDPSICMRVALGKAKKLPDQVYTRLKELGNTLGQLDLVSQIESLEAASERCSRELHQIRSGLETRKQNYQTLSLCAGAALVILLL